METVLVLNGVPVLVLCHGYLPQKFPTVSLKKPNELILIIPGNPGLISAYNRFAGKVHEKTKLPVWLLSYGGQTRGLAVPDPQSNPCLYDLDGQVLQKKELILQYLNDINLYVVGHSYGCSMSLSIMQDEGCAQVISKCYLLFPMIERFNDLERAKAVYYPATILEIFLKWLRPLVRGMLSFSIMRWILSMITAIVLSGPPEQCSKLDDLMAVEPLWILILNFHSCVEKISGRPFISTIKKHSNKLRLYYEENDGWGPGDFCRRIQAEVPDIQAEVNTVGETHSFMLYENSQMADIVSQWILEDKKKSQAS